MSIPETERRRDGGFTLWFTGLSGSGKSTIAHLVGPALDSAAPSSSTSTATRAHAPLEGPRLLEGGPRREHRAHRLGRRAAHQTRGAVIVSAISPYEETRSKARELVEESGPFVEVHVATSVDECARRDVKGLYAKAFRARSGVHRRRRPVRGARDARIDIDKGHRAQGVARCVSHSSAPRRARPDPRSGASMSALATTTRWSAATSRRTTRTMAAATRARTDGPPPKGEAGFRLDLPRQAAGLTSTQAVAASAAVQRPEGRPRRHARSAGDRRPADRARRGDQDRPLPGGGKDLPLHHRVGRSAATFDRRARSPRAPTCGRRPTPSPGAAGLRRRDRADPAGLFGHQGRRRARL